VSLGGGAVLREASQAILKATGKCIWLSASADYLFERIQSDLATQLRRPNLSQSGGYTEVADILAKRTPIYESLSYITVAVEGKTPDEICDEIAPYINSAGAEQQRISRHGASGV
jgi:shikimate kinase